MKLIGSRMEQEMREELIRSNLALREGSSTQLMLALASAKVNIGDSYVLNWIPEQAEDIYYVLVSLTEILVVEIPRGEGEVIFYQEILEDYEHKCSKNERIKIAVARGLQMTAR